MKKVTLVLGIPVPARSLYSIKKERVCALGGPEVKSGLYISSKSGEISADLSQCKLDAIDEESPAMLCPICNDVTHKTGIATLYRQDYSFDFDTDIGETINAVFKNEHVPNMSSAEVAIIGFIVGELTFEMTCGETRSLPMNGVMTRKNALKKFFQSKNLDWREAFFGFYAVLTDK